MPTEPPRKRLRRNARTCLPCKQRKVKCQLTEQNVDICAECIKSGAQCIPQSQSSEDTSQNEPHLSHEISQCSQDSRLARIESLLKGLVEAHQQASASATGSSGEQNRTKATPNGHSDTTHGLNIKAAHSLPREDVALLPNDPGVAKSLPSPPPSTIDTDQSLLSLLPSANDAFHIVSNSAAWLWGAETPAGSILGPDDAYQLLDTASGPQGSSLRVAKILLLFALYMQQLPATFDSHFLESHNVEESTKLIVDRVRAFLLSRDEDAFSLETLEALTLLSLLQLNDCALRKAWMTFRRSLDLSRLLGLQRSYHPSLRDSTDNDPALRRRLWLSTVAGDCYCSLLLGLEPGAGRAPFGPDAESWVDPCADSNSLVQRRITLIIARIAQRNAAGLAHDEAEFREIQAQLSDLTQSLPRSWWRPPAFSQDRPLDSAEEPNRLICQLWLLQARMFAHLPIGFGRTSGDAFQSLQACAEDSRITLQRYLGLQRVRNQISRCRTVDQAAFVAAIILLLVKVQLPCYQQGDAASVYDSDGALIEQVTQTFDSVGQSCKRENVSRSCGFILGRLVDIRDSNAELASFAHSMDKQDSPANAPFQAMDPSISPKPRDVMEDIVISSIMPTLNPRTPAFKLVQIYLDSRPEAPPDQYPEPRRASSHPDSDLTIVDFLDPAVFQ